MDLRLYRFLRLANAYVCTLLAQARGSVANASNTGMEELLIAHVELFSPASCVTHYKKIFSPSRRRKASPYPKDRQSNSDSRYCICYRHTTLCLRGLRLRTVNANHLNTSTLDGIGSPSVLVSVNFPCEICTLRLVVSYGNEGVYKSNAHAGVWQLEILSYFSRCVSYWIFAALRNFNKNSHQPHIFHSPG